MRQWSFLCALAFAASAAAAVPSSERSALVGFYQATGGSGWTNHAGWLGATGTECSWYGVGCDESQSHVTSLTLPENHLVGTLPSDIGSFSALVTLGLSYNELKGSIPPSLGQLHLLESLSFESNGLSGAIPPEISGLTSIQQLDLQQNQLTGAIPSQLYDLTTLRELHLGSNQLTGAIAPAIGNLRNLEVLALDQNQLSGAIPGEIAQLTALTRLDLGYNTLTGTIPPALSQLTALTILDLGHNQLTGTIPPSLGNLTLLEQLSLSTNGLTGAIPTELGGLTSLVDLYLDSNRLEGSIPDSLRNLTKLQEVALNENALSGALPAWIGEWTRLTALFVGRNQLSGNLPAGLATLTNLQYLDLNENQFTGAIVDFSALSNLVYLTIADNRFSGALPSSIGTLTKLSFAELNGNEFSGQLPTAIGNLASIEFLSLDNNDFEGSLPAEVGNLKHLYSFTICCNRLRGAIPPQIGDMSALQYLDVSYNGLTGAIPAEITKLTSLDDHRSSFSANGLYTTSATVRDFVNLKQYDGDFEALQTVAPANVHVVSTTDRSATLAWDPIRFSYYGGGYQIAASLTPGGAPVAIATTPDKEPGSGTVRNLSPSTAYAFTVSTVSYPSSGQKNLIVSDPSAVVRAETGPRVVAPADVAVTDRPNGIVQVDGVEVTSDSFSVTNFGDVATTITLDTNDTFFSVSPATFALQPGARQTIAIHSAPQPAGTYYGYVAIRGDGAPQDLYVTVVVLSSVRPAGTVTAEPLEARVELAGAAGSDSVRQVSFRNRGTATLTGIVVSDEPWVVPAAETVTIAPGQIGTVNFQVIRSRRPPGSSGALAATLSLIYVEGANASLMRMHALDVTSPTVSVSIVTVVDVTQPAVAAGPIPPTVPGDISFFVPGIVSSTATKSDVAILNVAASAPISDLRLYFTNGSQTSIASLQPLPAPQAVSLVNVANTVYGAANAAGTIQIRSGQWRGIGATAKISTITPAGSLGGEIPVFRSDRSVAGGQQIYLPGVAVPGDIVVQETAGAPADVRVEFLDEAGSSVGTPVDRTVGAWSSIVLDSAVPQHAVTAIVTNRDGSAGAITAYARVHDASGDTWSVTDWSAFYRYERNEAVRVVYANGGAATGPRRRRSIRSRGSITITSEALSTEVSATDLAIYNTETTTSRVTVRMTDPSGHAQEREIVLAPHATSVLRGVASTVSAQTAQIVVVPNGGRVAVSARSRGSLGGGTAIPVIAATAGLRLGQTQFFTGLEDSTSRTVTSAVPATFRTSYGLTETSGKPVTVRVSIFIGETDALVTATTSRTFELGANQQVVLPELLRSFAGGNRDSLYGDLHDVALQIEVVGGEGAVVPFVIATDNGTNDSNLRM